MPARARFRRCSRSSRCCCPGSGRGEAPQLTAAEADGAAPSLPPASIAERFYLNELLLKLTGARSAAGAVRCSTRGALEALRAGQESGIGAAAVREAAAGAAGLWPRTDGGCRTAEPVEPDAYYHFLPGARLRWRPTRLRRELSAAGCCWRWPPRSLIGNAERPDARPARCMRAAIDHCLEGRELQHARGGALDGATGAGQRADR